MAGVYISIRGCFVGGLRRENVVSESCIGVRFGAGALLAKWG